MSFLSIACGRHVRLSSFAGSAVVLLVLVSGCASSAPKNRVYPASTVDVPKREETLATVKPVAPPVVSEPLTSSKRTSSPEIEMQDHAHFDPAPIEVQ